MADFLVLIMHTYMEFVSTIFHADANAVSMMIDFFTMHSRQNAERYIHNQTGKRFLRSYRHTAHAEPPNTEPPQSKKPHRTKLHRMERGTAPKHEATPPGRTAPRRAHGTPYRLKTPSAQAAYMIRSATRHTATRRGNATQGRYTPI